MARSVVKNDGHSERNNHLDSLGHGLRLLERTKKDRVDDKTDTKKRRMCIVVIAWSTKSKRWMDVVKSRTPSSTAKPNRQSSKSFPLESEIRVTRLPPNNEAVQDHDTSGLECNESAMTDTANVGSSALRVTKQNEYSVGDDGKPGSYSTGNNVQGRCPVGFTEDARHRSHTILDAPEVMQTVCMERSKMVVEKDVSAATEGELCRAKEVVRLEAHVAILKKCNDLLEHEFTELKVTVSTFRMKYREANTGNRYSVFHFARNRRAVMHCMDEMHSICKEIFQLTFHPCFTELYRSMFHLAKHSTTETT